MFSVTNVTYDILSLVKGLTRNGNRRKDSVLDDWRDGRVLLLVHMGCFVQAELRLIVAWDNRVFNVNGRGVDMLEKALALVSCNGSSASFSGETYDSDPTTIIGSIVDPNCGLIWLWAECDGCVKYPVPLTVRQAAEISFAWLETKEAKAMKCDDWDADDDHDGDNTRGWRVYCEDWGHVGIADWKAICAVRSAYLWHGK